MSHHEKSEHVRGRLQQLLFSPKGGLEGVLLRAHSETIQVSLRHDQADTRTLQQAIGKPIELRASADRSPDARKGAHPVYKLQVITKIAGKAVPSNGGPRAISGAVASIQYTKHGEPNGVVLESGEFIHTRPLGMKKLKLKVGTKVTARGELRVTILGASSVEAAQVNRATLE
jgi:hypothetical protein